VVVHVFYLDIFDEIYTLLIKTKGISILLFLTGTDNILDRIKNSLPEGNFDIHYFPIKNQGRDILPFLRILPKIFADGHTIVLKLHTKGSNHLKRKVLWRHDLLSKLISESRIFNALDIFYKNPLIGMIGPAGNILPMYIYYGANGQIVNYISNKMGLNNEQLRDLNFVAGSMFYARKEALLPVLKLGLSDFEFEPEGGQKDGTMAHAVERAFTAGLIVANLQLADTDFCPEKPYLTISKSHYFTL